MGNENGEWIIHGIDPDDPKCLHSADELAKCVDEVGFMPLFKNAIEGFSVEERTIPDYWWTGDERDPWRWRGVIAEGGKVAYGKFFDRKAGFVSLDWISAFANWRREGFDFEGYWQSQKANYRLKKVMDLFDGEEAIFSNEIKRRAGFGKDGEKNFEGVITELQMRFFLVVKDFARRTSAKGEPYGWPVAIFSPPEAMWDSDILMRDFSFDPKVSKEKFYKRIKELYPNADEKAVARFMK